MVFQGWSNNNVFKKTLRSHAKHINTSSNHRSSFHQLFHYFEMALSRRPMQWSVAIMSLGLQLGSCQLYSMALANLATQLLLKTFKLRFKLVFPYVPPHQNLGQPKNLLHPAAALLSWNPQSQPPNARLTHPLIWHWRCPRTSRPAQPAPRREFWWRCREVRPFHPCLSISKCVSKSKYLRVSLKWIEMGDTCQQTILMAKNDD